MSCRAVIWTVCSYARNPAISAILGASLREIRSRLKLTLVAFFDLQVFIEKQDKMSGARLYRSAVQSLLLPQ